MENNVAIDAEYYLNQQLSKPLLRLFEPILGEQKAQSTLLRGEHTLTKTVVTSKVSALAAFTKKTAKCIGCKVSNNYEISYAVIKKILLQNLKLTNYEFRSIGTIK